MANYIYSDTVREIAEELISKLPQLEYIRKAAPNVAYLESDQKKRSAGFVIYGDCERVKPKMKEFTRFDYVVTIYTHNAGGLTVNQLKMLIFHELLHIDCERDEEGDLICNVRKHDLQDFRTITDRYGVDWVHEDDLPDILEGYN